MTLLASLLLLNALHAAPAPRATSAPTDSIGQVTRGGQRLVRHRVEPRETLSALARRYHVSVAQITAANPQITAGLGIGEVVLVPRPGPAGTASTPTKTAAPPAKTATAGPVPARYTVGKGETVFGIARRFGLAPAELIQLNGLPAGGAVRVGQELLLRAAEAAAPPVAAAGKPVAAPRPTPTAAKPTEAPATTTTTTPAPATTSATIPAAPTPAINPDQPARIATVTPAAPRDRDAPARDTPAGDTADDKPAPTRAAELAGRKTETGIAGVITGTGTDKYLALHKTAPVGTIMEVKNQMNGQTVYVRVIGTLPETGENQNVLVRISPRALQKLGTRDGKFRVETSYVP